VPSACLHKLNFIPANVLSVSSNCLVKVVVAPTVYQVIGSLSAVVMQPRRNADEVGTGLHIGTRGVELAVLISAPTLYPRIEEDGTGVLKTQ